MTIIPQIFASSQPLIANSLIEGFAFGIASILNTACLLPLYPGLIAFLAGSANNPRSRRATGWLGLLVLAGILTIMIFIGLALYLVQATFGELLVVLLPILYIAIIVFGMMMLAGRNPFARLQTAQAPLLSNPYLSAYLYGLLFGPMTLPCTGPLITSAFLLGASNTGVLVDGLAYFVGFGLGFGWPLVLLPLLTLPVQRRLVGWLAHNHVALTRASGVLLVSIGVFGILTELTPHYIVGFAVIQEAQFVYWALALTVAISVGYCSRTPKDDTG
jgi:cytochrome c-type biogenesis protein